MDFTYTSHTNQTFDLFGDDYFVNPDTFLQAALGYDNSYSTIKRIYRDKLSIEFELLITGTSEATTRSLYRAIISAFDDDAISGAPGTLSIGGYQAKAYCISHTVGIDDESQTDIPVTVTMLIDGAMWTKGTKAEFFKAAASTYGLDYPHDYPFDYQLMSGSAVINNNSGVACLPIITIYGAVTSPSITIGGNVYGCTASCTSTERIVIDATTKTIQKLDEYGNATNIFDTYSGTLVEQSGSYIFERIPTGDSVVVWSGAFQFDVEMVEQRPSPMMEAL